MPICTNCTGPIESLYTLYQTEYNLRLEQCTRCQAFADPYVEHDSLTLILDLILLKRGVYRHLIFNRGSPPRRIGQATTDKDSEGGDLLPFHQQGKWRAVLQNGSYLIFADAFIRWMRSRGPPRGESSGLTGYETDFDDFFKVLGVCIIDVVSFHGGVMIACLCLLPLLKHLECLRHGQKASTSNIREQFQLSHVPLTLLYSSITKFFLLLLLSIWETDSYRSEINFPTNYSSFGSPFDWMWRAFDDDKFDREWVVRNLLGGMSAGFGLRVILDCHPIFTTLMILVGWATKMSATWAISGSRLGSWYNNWWTIYSIP